MDFHLPPVGEGLVEVELVRWQVQPGDTVKRGQTLLEVMSDKASMEVPSPFSGSISEIVAQEGNKIQVGELILRYTKNGQPAKESETPETLTAQTSEAVPTESVKQTDSDTVAERVTAAAAEPKTEIPPAKRPPAAPSVRHLARRFKIDLNQVQGSGPGGRILLDDLTPWLKPSAANGDGNNKGKQHSNGKAPEALGLDLGQAGVEFPLAGVRKIIAERMVASKQAIPHYSYVDECNLTELVRVRGQLKETFAQVDLKLTFLPFMIRAVVQGLKHVPIANSTFDDKSNKVTSHDHYHIGIAVATSSGLVVPVIRDADQKDISQLSAEVERLSDAARNNKLRPDQMRGGTFTITSIGSIGGLISTPIINKPEVGIMGIGKVVRRPVYDITGNIVPADLVYLSFSFDHRIVDGAIGAAFGNTVIRALEHPATLLLPEQLPGGKRMM